MLHLLGFPADRTDLFSLLLSTLNDDDVVVLVDEGLQWASAESAMAALYNKDGITVHLLGGESYTSDPRSITATDLVVLSEQHPACSSWYP